MGRARRVRRSRRCQTREWLDFIAESQHASPVVAEITDDGRSIGYFSGLIIRKLGLRILGSSFPGWTTPYIGFNVRPGVSRSSLLGPFTQWAFRELGCLHVEISDRGFTPEDGASVQLRRSAYRRLTSLISPGARRICSRGWKAPAAGAFAKPRRAA